MFLKIKDDVKPPSLEGAKCRTIPEIKEVPYD